MGQRTCTYPGCTDRYNSLGLCLKHYTRLRKTGRLELATRPTPEERFWAKVDKDGPVSQVRPDLGRCWLWTASRNRDGYGQFGWQGKSVGAHRIGFEMDGEKIPEGLTVDHLCRVRHCIRRSHMEAVSQSVNWARGTFAERRSEYHESRRRSRHCKSGHEYTEANTLRTTSGHRACRQCRIAEPGRRGKRVFQGRDAEGRARNAEGARRYRARLKAKRQAAESA